MFFLESGMFVAFCLKPPFRANGVRTGEGRGRPRAAPRDDDQSRCRVKHGVMRGQAATAKACLITGYGTRPSTSTGLGYGKTRNEGPPQRNAAHPVGPHASPFLSPPFRTRTGIPASRHPDTVRVRVFVLPYDFKGFWGVSSFIGFFSP